MGLASTQTLGASSTVDAQHPDALSFIETAGPKACGPHRAARRTVGRLQPGPAGAAARPVARHRALEPGAQVEQGIEVGDARNVSLRCVHVLVPTNSPRTRSRISDSVIPRSAQHFRWRLDTPATAAPARRRHRGDGSRRRVDRPSTVYSCTIVSTPSPSTCESRKWASKSPFGVRSSLRNRRMPCGAAVRHCVCRPIQRRCDRSVHRGMVPLRLAYGTSDASSAKPAQMPAM